MFSTSKSLLKYQLQFRKKFRVPVKIERRKPHHAPINVDYIRQLLHSYCQNRRVKPCLTLYRRLFERDTRPPMDVYAKFIHTLGVRGKLERPARLIFEHALETGKRDPGVYAAMIRTYSVHGKFLEGIRLYREILSKDVANTRLAVYALQGFVRVRKWDDETESAYQGFLKEVPERFRVKYFWLQMLDQVEGRRAYFAHLYRERRDRLDNKQKLKEKGEWVRQSPPTSGTDNVASSSSSAAAADTTTTTTTKKSEEDFIMPKKKKKWTKEELLSVYGQEVGSHPGKWQRWMMSSGEEERGGDVVRNRGMVNNFFYRLMRARLRLHRMGSISSPSSVKGALIPKTNKTDKK